MSPNFRIVESVVAPSRTRVLIVDDDASVRITAAALLEDEYDVATARDGNEALEILAMRTFDVLCTDLRMPEMNGLELLRRATARQPGINGVLITGHRDYLSSAGSIDGISFTVLLKPYSADELLARIARAAQRARLTRTMNASGLKR